MSAEQFTRHHSTIRTIWDLSGDQQMVLLRSIAFKAIQATFEALPAAVLIYIVNELRIGDLSDTEILVSCGVVLACVFGQWVAGFLANRSAWIATFELFGHLRARLLNHVRRLPMSFHDNQSTGQVVTVMTQDVSAVENFTHEPLQMMIGAAVAPVVVFVVLMFQDTAMATATVASVILATPAFIWSNSVFVRLAAKRQGLQADASSRMIEYIQGLAVIRAFGLAGERLGLFQKSMEDFRSVNSEMAVKLSPLGSLFLSVVFLGIPLVIYSGAYWLLGGTLDPGVFLIFAVLSLRVYLPLIAATQGFESLRMADASLDRISNLLANPVDDHNAAATADPTTFEVDFHNVNFAYDGQKNTLQNISFTAKQGQVTAIVGPSGAGKSTLLQLCAGLRKPDAGRILIGGVDQQTLSPNQLFDAVTPVFQNVYLFPGTIYNNIAFGREDADRAAVINAAKAAQVHAFVEQLPDGYDTKVQESGSNLSGGERQRIAIARAILKDAPIVLLDEVTSALDSTNERLVQEALAALVKEKTVIVIAHRLATIQNADQIVVLENGLLAQLGQHNDLLAETGVYQSLWASRQQAAQWQLRK
ncbi:MAG: ABC transporter ATP-binding protein [Pseudomonadota bacterium]